MQGITSLEENGGCMNVIPYLSFEGKAEEAMEFYKKVFIGEVIYLMRYSEHEDFPISDDYKEKILHAQLKVGDGLIYLSDAYEGEKLDYGNHMEVNINFETEDALEKAYEMLSESAVKISLPLQKMFWNAKFATLIDQFGIGWSLNYTYPEEQ